MKSKKYYWHFPHSPFSVYRTHLKLFPIFLRFLKKYDLYNIFIHHYNHKLKIEIINEATNPLTTSCNMALWDGKQEAWEDYFLVDEEYRSSVIITTFSLYVGLCNMMVSHKELMYENKFYDLCKDLKNKIIQYEQIYI